MNPRRRHRATSFSMSMQSSPPPALDDPDRADLDAQGLLAQLGHEVELVDLGGGLDIVIIAEAAQLGPALADLQCAQENPPVVLEAVPRQPCGVVDAYLHLLGQVIDQSAGEQRVFERDIA